MRWSIETIAVDPLRDRRAAPPRENLAPDGTLADRQSAAAEPALLEAALPEVANLARGEDAVDFAEDVREHGAAASAGAGDVEDDRGHESPRFSARAAARRPPSRCYRRRKSRRRRAAARFRQQARSPAHCRCRVHFRCHCHQPPLTRNRRGAPRIPRGCRRSGHGAAIAAGAGGPAGRVCADGGGHANAPCWPVVNGCLRALAGPHQLEDEDQAEHHEQRERERDRGELDDVAQLREPARRPSW